MTSGVRGMSHRPLTNEPSAQLEKLVRLQMIGETLVTKPPRP